MSKQQKIDQFDPNGFATNDQLFGLPFTYGESETIVLPVPWEVTVSYRSGTANGPDAIREASLQVDLFDPVLPGAWKRGIHMLEVSHELKEKSDRLRVKAEEYLNKLTEEADPKSLMEVNHACGEMVQWVEDSARHLLEEGKQVALLGGDHSTPLGFIRALGRQHNSFGILQIDAHADLRDAYEGFTFSHASIMHNALRENCVEKLVQVGIRDYCEAEYDRIQSDDRIETFFDRDLKQGAYHGISWQEQCEKIIDALPQKVYLSFDIDGLDPKLCPNTGTPVAGGFETEEVLFLLDKLVKSGRTIIGLDLNEVSPGENEWDANVGARLLYKLCNLMALSQQ